MISINEKFLVVGMNHIIEIFHLITRKIIKSITIKNGVQICTFTHKCYQLLCGDMKGYLYCYEFSDNFKKIFKTKIHS